MIHSHIQIEADSRGTNKKTDTQTDRVTVTCCICLSVSSVAPINTLRQTGLAPNIGFPQQYASTALVAEACHFLFKTLSVWQRGPFVGKSSAAQEMIYSLFVGKNPEQQPAQLIVTTKRGRALKRKDG